MSKFYVIHVFHGASREAVTALGPYDTAEKALDMMDRGVYDEAFLAEVVPTEAYSVPRTVQDKKFRLASR